MLVQDLEHAEPEVRELIRHDRPFTAVDLLAARVGTQQPLRPALDADPLKVTL